MDNDEMLLWLIARVLEGRAMVSSAQIMYEKAFNGVEFDISIKCLDIPRDTPAPASPIRFEIMLAMLRQEFRKLPTYRRFAAAEQAMLFWCELAKGENG